MSVHPPEGESPSSSVQLFKKILFGSPRDLDDPSLMHRISLVAILAWIGLGADGLSSSSYGPEEAFRTLGEHSYLALILAAMVAGTVFIIATAYSRIIEHFPHGGGGYIVATNLLGARAGVVSGSALLVDYILTIAVSIASSCDALFSFLPATWMPYKFLIEICFIIGLTVLNIRGVRESVLALTPIFILFILTHVVLILVGIIRHIPELPQTAEHLHAQYTSGLSALGIGGLTVLLLRAYSMGAGTFTGIEAVSNGLPIMREPRVQTAKKTMRYMAVSLAFTAAGLIVCYLLWDIRLQPGKTMNAVLLENFSAGLPFGSLFVIMSLISEGALLIVAAQAGFLDGPRVMANMANDYWLPRKFGTLSDRLTTRNGIVIMGLLSLAALFYTKGDVRRLVIMYSINVFLTFSLSMFGMLIYWLFRTKEKKGRGRKIALFSSAFLLCVSILAVTIVVKFLEGGWLTLFLTGGIVGLCLLIKRHYLKVKDKLVELYTELENVPIERFADSTPLDPTQPTAAVLVAGYSGLGIHTVLNIFRKFPGQFKNIVFLSVGVLDSGAMKADDAIDELKARTSETLARYGHLAEKIGIASEGEYSIGTDAVDEALKICRTTAEKFPQITFFAGKIVFEKERWYQTILHNETAFAIQKRLQWEGQTMVIIPAKMH